MPDFCAPATIKSSRSTLWRLIPSTSPIVIPLRLDVYRDEFCNHRSWTAVLAIDGSWLGEIGISRAYGRRICDRSDGDPRSRRDCDSHGRAQSQALARRASANSMRHPPGAQLLHDRGLACHRAFLRPVSVLPGEIPSQSRLDVTFAPSGLKIFLALRSVAPVQTTFPIDKLQWLPQSG